MERICVPIVREIGRVYCLEHETEIYTNIIDWSYLELYLKKFKSFSTFFTSYILNSYFYARTAKDLTRNTN